MLIVLHGLSGGSHEIYLRHVVQPIIGGRMGSLRRQLSRLCEKQNHLGSSVQRESNLGHSPDHQMAQGDISQPASVWPGLFFGHVGTIRSLFFPVRTVSRVFLVLRNDSIVLISETCRSVVYIDESSNADRRITTEYVLPDQFPHLNRLSESLRAYLMNSVSLATCLRAQCLHMNGSADNELKIRTY